MSCSKPSTTEESNELWVFVDQMHFSELSNDAMSVDVSNDSAIMSVAMPNAMVDAWQSSSINNKLALLGSMIETPMQSTIDSSAENLLLQKLIIIIILVILHH